MVNKYLFRGFVNGYRFWFLVLLPIKVIVIAHIIITRGN